MRIQHNIMAMNAYRNLGTNQSALAKNLEKLSSGYRINRAGDDAAGLAISEKMRAQITGLDAAQKNVKDGISLVKTAEGALQEVHDMLNRMKYLATQSANGTYDNAVDRDNLQKEVNSLLAEIDRIGDSANFNGMKLLDGTLGNAGDAAATVPYEGAAMNGGGMTAADVTIDNTANAKASLTAATASNGGVDIKITTANMATGDSFTLGSVTYKMTNGGGKLSGSETAVEFKDFDELKTALENHGYTLTHNGGTTNLNKDDVINIKKMDAASTKPAGTVTASAGSSGNTAPTLTVNQNNGKGETTVVLGTNPLTSGMTITIGGATFTMVGNTGGTASNATFKDLTELQAALNAKFGDGAYTIESDKKGGGDFAATATLTIKLDETKLKDGAAGGGGNGTLTLQIGDTADKYNRMDVTIGDMRVQALGLGGLDITTASAAAESIDKIKTAINSVSSTRGDLGAIQNRLEHTSNNLGVMKENIQDAESTIRDTDVADEMMKYTKNNILIQSAQAMLAQANQVPQGVLQLLQ